MFVGKNISESRLETCKQCEFYIEMPGICSKCSCVMPVKVKLAMAKCPENKWPELLIPT